MLSFVVGEFTVERALQGIRGWLMQGWGLAWNRGRGIQDLKDMEKGHGGRYQGV